MDAAVAHSAFAYMKRRERWFELGPGAFLRGADELHSCLINYAHSDKQAGWRRVFAGPSRKNSPSSSNGKRRADTS